MSFILDALKKSEAERLRKSTPGVADIPDARPPSRTPRWAWIVAGLLLATNLAVLAALLLRPDAPQATPTVSRPLEMPAATAPAPSFSELVAEAKERQGSAGGSSVPSSSADSARSEPPPREEPAPAAAVSTPAQQAIDVGDLASFEELRARGELILPDLHLDLHVYADRPQDRFVVVNMTRYREGAVLAEGPVVRQILPSGVVLEQNGTRFFLPR
jgi:general secretion pathway protein B